MTTVLYDDPILRGIQIALLVLAVTGCDGSNNRTLSPVTEVPPPDETANPDSPPAATLDCDAIAADMGLAGMSFDALPGGIWNGTITNETKDRSSHLMALVAEDGRARLLYYPSAASLKVTLEVNDDKFTGDGLAYADTIDLWSDGSAVTAVDTYGIVAERNSIKGSWSTASNDSGCFELDSYYDWLYEETSALEFLEGVWLGDPTLTVDQDGSFSGQGTCTWAGNFVLIDASYNMYEVVADLSDCNVAGSYRGLAYRDYVFAPERLLVLAIESDQRSIRVTLDD